jgi:hypothetical protein
LSGENGGNEERKVQKNFSVAQQTRLISIISSFKFPSSFHLIFLQRKKMLEFSEGWKEKPQKVVIKVLD